jgi:hypothetical protein
MPARVRARRHGRFAEAGASAGGERISGSHCIVCGAAGSGVLGGAGGDKGCGRSAAGLLQSRTASAAPPQPALPHSSNGSPSTCKAVAASIPARRHATPATATGRLHARQAEAEGSRAHTPAHRCCPPAVPGASGCCRGLAHSCVHSHDARAPPLLPPPERNNGFCCAAGRLTHAHLASPAPRPALPAASKGAER